MQNEINYVKVGNRIRIEREKFDMTREKLSELLNLSPYFLGQIERGERRMSINTLINITECLHVSIDYLFFERVNTNTNANTDVLHSLINKCSEKEIKVIEGLIKLILPHLTR